MQTKQKKGFTLIELLVVIAIIGILSAIGLVALNGARERARDAKRKSDLSQISTALVIYSDDFQGLYIASGTATVVSTALTGLVPNYLNALPTTPSGATTANDYWYRTNGAAFTEGQAYAISEAFYLASKLEGGNTLWFVLNNLGFGGEVTGSGTVAAASSITCDGATAVAGTITGCERAVAVQ